MLLHRGPETSPHAASPDGDWIRSCLAPLVHRLSAAVSQSKRPCIVECSRGSGGRLCAAKAACCWRPRPRLLLGGAGVSALWREPAASLLGAYAHMLRAWHPQAAGETGGACLMERALEVCAAPHEHYSRHQTRAACRSSGACLSLAHSRLSTIMFVAASALGAGGNKRGASRSNPVECGCHANGEEC
jgi:hypothetical protein